ncbi:MAG TPA: isocitrate lyase/phosphoenolpyruvate mutase family protein [Candidatus Cybelea sp.]|nr:isocitrate lyase/phosphoenolpyruvate mutase family protein [Candidatus Cybelea sp.]
MPATQAEKGARFKALHQGPGAFVIPNPFDIGTARILTALGFKALATTSAGFAFTLGRRDGAVARHEAISHAAIIVGATELPVSADLENGFGDAPEAAALTVTLAGTSGLAGCSIEDASGDAAKPIYDKSLAVERIAASVEAARKLPYPFMLTARAENFLHGRPDLDDTIARLRAFADAGADVLYAPGLPDLAAIRTVCSAVSKPVNVLMGNRGRSFPVSELAAAGVRRISLGSGLSRVALGAVIKAAREINETGTFGVCEDGASFAELSRFMLGKQN